MTINLDLLDNVNGEENSIIFYTEENEIENLTEDEFQLLENFDLYINGSNNKIRIKIKHKEINIRLSDSVRWINKFIIHHPPFH